MGNAVVDQELQTNQQNPTNLAENANWRQEWKELEENYHSGEGELLILIGKMTKYCISSAAASVI